MTPWKYFVGLVMDETDPALSKTPKYIFDANEAVAIDAGFALRGEAAFVSRVLDLQLAEHLITRSSWRGRGFATIVSPAVTSSLTDVAAIVLHELCHWYDHGAKVGPVSNAVERSRQLIRMMRDCAKPDPKPATQQSPAPALPTWHNHGLDGTEIKKKTADAEWKEFQRFGSLPFNALGFLV